MQIKVLFDNEKNDNKYSTGFGFSCIINNSILFDTGSESESLFHNMDIMGIEPSLLDSIIISHDHWDHIGGLWDLLKKKSGLKVYSCPNFSQEFKDKVRNLEGNLIELENLTQISDNIYCTGETAGKYNDEYLAEQALILKTQLGISVICGCAHPGIIKILKRVKKDFPSDLLYLALGGFHLRDKNRDAIIPIIKMCKDLGVIKIAPSHCTGSTAIKLFNEAYGDGFIDVKIGDTITI